MKLIFTQLKVNFTNIESIYIKLKFDVTLVKFDSCERSEAMALKAFSRDAREAPSACIYQNRRQRIKSLTMVVETTNNNQFSYFNVLT